MYSLSAQVNAQKYYAAIGLGYYQNGFSIPVSYGTNTIYQTRPQGSVGYVLNDNFSVELGGNQLTWTYSQDVFAYISIRMLRLMPSLKYTFYKHGASYSFYAKGGMSIGVDNYMRQDIAWVSDLPPYTLHISKIEYKGGLAPGYVFAIGGECKIYKNLSFYIELMGIVNYWSRSNNVNIIELTGYSNDEIDRTPVKVGAAEYNVSLKYSFW